MNEPNLGSTSSKTGIMNNFNNSININPLNSLNNSSAVFNNNTSNNFQVPTNQNLTNSLNNNNNNNQDNLDEPYSSARMHNNAINNSNKNENSLDEPYSSARMNNQQPFSIVNNNNTDLNVPFSSTQKDQQTITSSSAHNNNNNNLDEPYSSAKMSNQNNTNINNNNNNLNEPYSSAKFDNVQNSNINNNINNNSNLGVYHPFAKIENQSIMTNSPPNTNIIKNNNSNIQNGNLNQPYPSANMNNNVNINNNIQNGNLNHQHPSTNMNHNVNINNNNQNANLEQPYSSANMNNSININNNNNQNANLEQPYSSANMNNSININNNNNQNANLEQPYSSANMNNSININNNNQSENLEQPYSSANMNHKVNINNNIQNANLEQPYSSTKIDNSVNLNNNIQNANLEQPYSSASMNHSVNLNNNIQSGNLNHPYSSANMNHSVNINNNIQSGNLDHPYSSAKMDNSYHNINHNYYPYTPPISNQYNNPNAFKNLYHSSYNPYLSIGPQQFNNNNNNGPSYSSYRLEQIQAQKGDPIKIAQEKIENAKKYIEEELSKIEEFQISKIYQKFFDNIVNVEQKYLILKNKFESKDKAAIGYISYNDFIDVIDEFLVLSNDELKILFSDPILINDINNNLYQYKPFLKKILNYSENEMSILNQEFNLEFNPYIIDLRNIIKDMKLDIRNIWSKTLNGDLLCDKKNFHLLFEKESLGKYYYDLEIDYIFSLFSSPENNLVKFKTFKDAISRQPYLDKRLFYQHKLKSLHDSNYFTSNNNNIKSVKNENKEQLKYSTLKTSIMDINKENYYNENKNVIESKQNKNTTNRMNIIPVNNNINNKTENLKSNIKIKKYVSKIYDINKELTNKISTIRNNLNNDEVKYAKENRIDDIMHKRAKKANEKVNFLLNQHEEYIVLKLFSFFNKNFAFLGTEPQMIFIDKDIQKTKRLNFNDFYSVLNSALKLNFNKNDLSMLLNSLNNKDNTNTLYSYEEFLDIVYNFPFYENGKISKIEYIASTNFNPYLEDFKNFINTNKLDIGMRFFSFSKDKKNLYFNEFINFCYSLQYILSHPKEYKIIFDVLSDNQKFIAKEDLNEFIKMKTLTEIEFIEEGKIGKKNEIDIKKNWYKFIPKYSKYSYEFYLKTFKPFENLFALINKQRNKFGLINLADLFSLTCKVDEKGNILKSEFVRVLSLIDIYNPLNVEELMVYLQEDTNKDIFQLALFLGIFSVFHGDIKSENKIPFNFNSHVRLDKSNIIFHNNYGNFTQEDFNEMKSLSKYICQIIHNDKKMKISDYFYKFDFFKNQYFNLEQFKCILFDDLEIEIKNEAVNTFLCYLIENNKVKDFYIITLSRLIFTLIDFAEIKDEDKILDVKQDEEMEKRVNKEVVSVRLRMKPNADYAYSPNSGIYA